jgi:hypothetical protein
VGVAHGCRSAFAGYPGDYSSQRDRARLLDLGPTMENILASDTERGSTQPSPGSDATSNPCSPGLVQASAPTRPSRLLRLSGKQRGESGYAHDDEGSPVHHLISASAFSSQYVMPISRYIVVAVARCPWACSRLAVRR